MEQVKLANQLDCTFDIAFVLQRDITHFIWDTTFLDLILSLIIITLEISIIGQHLILLRHAHVA